METINVTGGDGAAPSGGTAAAQEAERIRVALDATTEPSVLAALIADSASFDVLTCVARNPSTPPGTLASLARHPAWPVRRDVAANPGTDPDVLDSLARWEFVRRGRNEQVRIEVARNPCTSPQTLNRFVLAVAPFSRRPTVRRKLLLAGITGLWAPRLWNLATLVAVHPSTPPETLTALAHSWPVEVSDALLNNPAIPEEALVVLGMSRSDGVREGVGVHPRTPTRTLSALAVDESLYVRDAVAANGAAPSYVFPKRLERSLTR